MKNIKTSGRMQLQAPTLLAALLAIALLAGCSTDVEQVSAPKSSGQFPSTVRFVQSNASVLIAGPAREYWEGSDLVCCGVYQGMSEPFLVEPVDGAEPCYFTDFYFKVDDLVKGQIPRSSLERDSIISVRQKGGLGTMMATVDLSAAEPEEGKRYLLYLYAVDDGADYNTDGDHSYLLGKRNGLWSESDRNVFFSPFSEETINSNTLRTYANDSASPQHSMRPVGLDAYLEEVEEHYMNGNITLEIYEAEKLHVEKLKTERAHILTGVEALAAEEDVCSRISAIYS